MNGVPGASRVNSVVQNPMVYSEEKAAVHICIVRCFAGESKEGTVSTMSSANRKFLRSPVVRRCGYPRRKGVQSGYPVLEVSWTGCVV